MSEYIHPLSESVERTHIRYPNRYGLMLAGDLYTAKGMDRSKPQMAVIVGAPYGGVKEQGPCVYANELAQLAAKLKDLGETTAYEQIMQAVSDFEKGNMRLSTVLAAME